MAASKKSPYEKTNVTLRRKIKHPAIRLAQALEFPSLSALIERLLEVQLVQRGEITPDIEPIPEERLRPILTNGKAHERKQT